MSYLHQQQSGDGPGPVVPPNPPPSNRKPPPENKPSLLLSKEENQFVFEILGKGRQTLSTAVVQLLVPTPNQRDWQIKETGVVCFVRDQLKKSYFIQVFSLRTKNMVFRQEIYSQFEYQMPVNIFLTFEGDNSMVGLNFADITEATNFRDVLDNKLETKRQRRNERRSRLMEQTQNHNNAHSPVHQQPPSSMMTMTSTVHSNNNNNINNHSSSSQLNNHNNSMGHRNNQRPPQTPQQQQYSSSTTSISNGGGGTGGMSLNMARFKSNSNKAGGKRGGGDKDKKKGGLRKEDIGIPMDFRHVQHVGWDPNKGYDLDGVDNDFQTFFEKVGVSANQLRDENTRQFIYNFIEKHGGVEAVKNDISSPGRGPAPLPGGAVLGSSTSSSSSPPALPNTNSNPPPVPARHPLGTGPGVGHGQGHHNSNSSSSLGHGTNKPIAPPPPSRPIPPPPPASSGGGPPLPPHRTVTSRNPPIPPAPNFSNNNSNFNNNNNNNTYSYNSPLKPPVSPDSPVQQPHQQHPHKVGIQNGPVPPPPPPLPTGIPLPPPMLPPAPAPPPMSYNTDESDSGFSERTVTGGGSKDVGAAGDDRSTLMQQIQSGVQLKKVSAEIQAKKSSGTLADCLSQIKIGVDLKPVPETTKPAPAESANMDGLAGALARALAERSRAINPSDSDSSDGDDADEFEDDEWE